MDSWYTRWWEDWSWSVEFEFKGGQHSRQILSQLLLAGHGKIHRSSISSGQLASAQQMLTSKTKGGVNVVVELGPGQSWQ
jgi:hypothetical protein